MLSSFQAIKLQGYCLDYMEWNAIGRVKIDLVVFDGLFMKIQGQIVSLSNILPQQHKSIALNALQRET